MKTTCIIAGPSGTGAGPSDLEVNSKHVTDKASKALKKVASPRGTKRSMETDDPNFKSPEVATRDVFGKPPDGPNRDRKKVTFRRRERPLNPVFNNSDQLPKVSETLQLRQRMLTSPSPETIA